MNRNELWKSGNERRLSKGGRKQKRDFFSSFIYLSYSRIANFAEVLRIYTYLYVQYLVMWLVACLCLEEDIIRPCDVLYLFGRAYQVR
jgi:hypothetical protein